MEHKRDWAVVAPWWKWSDPKSPSAGRASRPVFQKYDTPNLVNDFLKDPQHSLTFVDDDLVHSVQKAPEIHLPPGATKPRRFSNVVYAKDGTNTRKIFLDTHKRFYLVICEIHCDEPGFPNVGRDKVCEVGFVVRRRTVDVPATGAKEIGAILQRLGADRAQMAMVDGLAANVAQPETRALGSALFDEGKLTSLVKRRASVQAALIAEKARFNDWVARFGVAPQLQGWLKSAKGFDKVGAWSSVEETPSDLGDESTFPMYPLIPAAGDKAHAGKFGTIYFGVLPTGSDEHEEGGRARFDDQQFYEVRVFARRHDKAHLRGSPCACPDDVFWSAPTEVYKLAPHFDLVGTSNRPVTIQMPDLNVLAAQAKPSLGVALAKPKGSLMAGASAADVGGGLSAALEICSFAIPLITIVASFLFELFLPIVTLAFGLFFLLKLKFCIPPVGSVSAGITAELSLDMSVADENALSAKVNPAINSLFPTAAARLEADYSPIALGNMDFELERASNPATTPKVTDTLQWEIEVKHA